MKFQHCCRNGQLCCPKVERPFDVVASVYEAKATRSATVDFQQSRPDRVEFSFVASVFQALGFLLETVCYFSLEQRCKILAGFARTFRFISCSAFFAGLWTDNVEGVFDHLIDVDSVDGLSFKHVCQLLLQLRERRTSWYRLMPALHHHRIPLHSTHLIRRCSKGQWWSQNLKAKAKAKVMAKAKAWIFEIKAIGPKDKAKVWYSRV